MRSNAAARRRTTGGVLRLGLLLPVPMLVVLIVVLPHVVAAASADPTVEVSFGQVTGQARHLPMPPMDQMMMPMAESGDHGDEIQVVLQLRNDTDAVSTVPFERVRMHADDGSWVEPTDGLRGDLVLRPHASAEERLRFTGHTTSSVQISVPDGDDDRTLTLAVAQ